LSVLAFVAWQLNKEGRDIEFAKKAVVVVCLQQVTDVGLANRRQLNYGSK
jgi:hypothetical protein